MPTAAGETRPTVLLNRYQLEGVLGVGATGEVYRGHDARLERPVAVKLLRAELSIEPAVRRRFEGEARAAARLSHPNVVMVFDSGEHDGRAFIVMERLPGRTLADEIARGPFDSARVRQLGTEVLAALAAAHDAGILHRDIKPRNVLLARRGHWKVTDFGIAKLLDETDLTATGIVVGTPAYTAPERHAGGPATVRSDLYAVGVVLYEAAAGERPFRGDNALAVARAVLDGAVEPVARRCPGLDPSLAAAIDHAMAREPASRFASAGEMQRALQAHLDPAATIPQSAPPPTASLTTPVVGRARRTPSRRTVSGWAAAALAVVALTIIGVVALTRGAPRTGAPPAPSRTPPTATSPLPSPLDRALTQLEQSVRR
jgi:serine/threonine protein kinase